MPLETFSPEETARLAFDLAKDTEAGAVIALDGPLGAGKTVFAQGFARGLGCEEQVTSPTFTLMNIYEGGRLTLYHFDLYRLTAAELEAIGFEDYLYAGGACLVEWAGRAAGAMPEQTLWVTLTHGADDGHRYIDIKRA